MVVQYNTDGSQFVLATLSNAEQVHPDVQSQVSEKYAVAFDFDQPDRIIEEFARQEHIAYLKLMPAFREYHLRTGKYLRGFGSSRGGHWNENGHRLAAEKIFEFLKDKHIVPLNSVSDVTGKLEPSKILPPMGEVIFVTRVCCGGAPWKNETKAWIQHPLKVDL